MLSALISGSQVPIHRHEDTSETVVCLQWSLYKIMYEEATEYVEDAGDMMRKKGLREVSRHLLCLAEGQYGMQIPAGV